MNPRRAKMDDAPALAPILSEWVQETDWMPKLHTPKEDIGFVKSLIDAKTVWLVESNEQPIGFIATDGAEIPALYVAKGKRGKGLGKTLLDHAKSAQSRLSLWTFQANRGARAFYAREGFREIERTDGAGNDEKLPDLRLIWEQYP